MKTFRFELYPDDVMHVGLFADLKEPAKLLELIRQATLDIAFVKPALVCALRLL